MIEPILEEINKKLPVVWPLHQFIALNPLWDKIDTDLLHLTKALHGSVGLQATLSLKEYDDLYHKGLISESSLKASIQTVLAMQFSQKQDFEAIQALLEAEVFNFITSSTFQERCHHYEQEFAFSEPTEKLYLLAYQARAYCYNDPLSWIKTECLRWVAAFFDRGQAIWPMPCSHHSLFEDWRDCLSSASKKWAHFFNTSPKSVDGFIMHCVEMACIPEDKLETYFFQIAWQLKGWAGYIKWLNAYPNNPWSKKKASLAMLIAMWLAYECFFITQKEKKLQPLFEKRRNQPDLWDDNGDLIDPLMPGSVYEIEHAATQKKKRDTLLESGIDSSLSIWLDYLSAQAADMIDEQQRADFLKSLSTFSVDRFSLRWIWQTAWETHYHQHLIQQLNPSPPNESKKARERPPQAQWIFCIDTRSERLRYFIEQQGEYETFGFAGFFGFTFQLQSPKDSKTTSQCPALIRPTHILKYSKQIQSSMQRHLELLNAGLKRTKQHLLAPFALFEMFGCLFLFKLLLKTMCPHLALRMKQWITAQQKDKQSSMKWPFDKDHHPNAFTIDQAADGAEQLLRLIGLTESFSPYIIICGHQASSDNNPYQAGLDCGACGGNSGYINAVVACQAFNHPDVRKKLAQRGLSIPSTTRFIAACHNTTLDKLTWFDDSQPDSEVVQSAVWQTLKKAASDACQSACDQRMQQLKGEKNPAIRASHWAELVPEMGLANNAAMVIGPRWLTQNKKLEGRVFLHSYEPVKDPKGEWLESILTAPLIVAHWINFQYYLSTTDPQLYGSGNKALHNVIGKLGIIEGNQGDLQVGLPLQSVFHQSDFVHEPMRLLAIIYAKRSHVDAIIDKQPSLKALVEGHWLFLHIIEPCHR